MTLDRLRAHIRDAETSPNHVDQMWAAKHRAILAGMVDRIVKHPGPGGSDLHGTGTRQGVHAPGISRVPSKPRDARPLPTSKNQWKRSSHPPDGGGMYEQIYQGKTVAEWYEERGGLGLPERLIRELNKEGANLRLEPPIPDYFRFTFENEPGTDGSYHAFSGDNMPTDPHEALAEMADLTEHIKLLETNSNEIFPNTNEKTMLGMEFTAAVQRMHSLGEVALPAVLEKGKAVVAELDAAREAFVTGSVDEDVMKYINDEPGYQLAQEVLNPGSVGLRSEHYEGDNALDFSAHKAQAKKVMAAYEKSEAIYAELDEYRKWRAEDLAARTIEEEYTPYTGEAPRMRRVYPEGSMVLIPKSEAVWTEIQSSPYEFYKTGDPRLMHVESVSVPLIEHTYNTKTYRWEVLDPEAPKVIYPAPRTMMLPDPAAMRQLRDEHPDMFLERPHEWENIKDRWRDSRQKALNRVNNAYPKETQALKVAMQAKLEPKYGKNEIRDVLAKYRDFGGEPIEITNQRATKAVKQLRNQVVPYLPDDWIRQSNIRGYVKPLDIKLASSKRAHYEWSGTIRTDGSESTLFHEMGHRLETSVPAIAALEQAYYSKRTEGESLKRLEGYRGEDARHDEWANPYSGKEYHVGIYPNAAYEVTSMGLGYFYGKARDPEGYMGKQLDQEHYEFIAGMLVSA